MTLKTMKFSIRDLLVSLRVYNDHMDDNLRIFAAAFILTLPVTIIVAFVGFAIGRRKFSLLALIWLITLVAIAVFFATWVPIALIDVSG